MPGLQYDGAAFQYYRLLRHRRSLAAAGIWYAYTTRSDYLQTTEFANISFDVTDKLNVEAGVVHFHSDFSYYSPYGAVRLHADDAEPARRLARTSGTASSASTTRSPTR